MLPGRAGYHIIRKHVLPGNYMMVIVMATPAIRVGKPCGGNGKSLYIKEKSRLGIYKFLCYPLWSSESYIESIKCQRMVDLSIQVSQCGESR